MLQSTDLVLATTQEMCRMTIVAAFLGFGNFCERFKQCCVHGRSIKCTISIPCKDVFILSHSSDWVPTHYFPSREYVVKGANLWSDYSINVRQVTEGNVRFIPPFTDVGFEFRDISQLFTSHDLVNYSKMTHRLSRLAEQNFFSSNGVDDAHLTHGDEGILLRICDNFAESNAKRIVSKIENAAFMKVDDGTKIHFDAEAGINNPMKGRTIIRAWIPLTNIDNFPLAVGDARSYYKPDGPCKGDNSIRGCATTREFKDVVWYQREQMTPKDAVFWNKHAVPHCSSNLGNDRNTKERIALIFEFMTQEVA